VSVSLGGNLGYRKDGAETFAKAFEKIFAVFDCFAPRVAAGSMIIFDHNVFHGTFCTRSMTTTRYSIDCRAVGEFHIRPSTSSFAGMTSRVDPLPGFFGHQIERLRLLRAALAGNGPARRRVFVRLTSRRISN
jgi:hypothetical protein